MKQRGGDDKQAQFFMLRVWPQKLDDGSIEFRGNVQHVMTGEVHDFKDWEGLRQQLAQMTTPGDIDPGTQEWRALGD